jgi:hypothetical protein
MSIKTIPLSLLIVACLLVTVLPVQAQTDDQNGKVVYLNTFSSDPHWTTNSPSSDYWDPSMGMYHFSLEPSTGNYAYTKVDSASRASRTASRAPSSAHLLPSTGTRRRL